MPTVPRRALLQFAALGLAGIPAALGTADGAFARRQSLPTQLVKSSAGGKFGPTGRHWPARTAKSNVADRTIEVAANWAAIAGAISTAVKYPRQRVRILVRPGTLPGFGNASASTPVLRDVGALARSYRILVRPRDGIDSVKFSGSLRIHNIKGVTFAGFMPFPHALTLTAVQDFAWAWSKAGGFNLTGNGGTTRDIELVECVTPNHALRNHDTWAFRTWSHELSNVLVNGCYIAPSYMPKGSKEHVDTLQLSGPLAQRNVTIRDTAVFASTHAAIIPSAIAQKVRLEHSLVVAGNSMLSRHPIPAGADNFSRGFPIAVNGEGTTNVLGGANNIFVGAVHGSWSDASNIHVSVKPRAKVARGAFTLNTSLASVSRAWLDAHSTAPTDAYLRSIWKL